MSEDVKELPRTRNAAAQYALLDEIMTELFEVAGLKVTPQVQELLREFNWELREALGLPNILH